MSKQRKINSFRRASVDLRPSGDAGLDLVACGVAIDCLVVEVVCGLGLQRVRPGTDER